MAAQPGLFRPPGQHRLGVLDRLLSAPDSLGQLLQLRHTLDDLRRRHPLALKPDKGVAVHQDAKPRMGLVERQGRPGDRSPWYAALDGAAALLSAVVIAVAARPSLASPLRQGLSAVLEGAVGLRPPVGALLPVPSSPIRRGVLGAAVGEPDPATKVRPGRIEPERLHTALGQGASDEHWFEPWLRPLCHFVLLELHSDGQFTSADDFRTGRRGCLGDGAHIEAWGFSLG